MQEDWRLEAEWITLNAIRGMTKIASHGSMTLSTYDRALELGAELYPDLLGDDVSLLQRERESDATKEYRQKARLSTIRDSSTVTALELVQKDIAEYEGLLSLAKTEKGNKHRVDQLKNRLAIMNKALEELDKSPHSEHQLIFRDVYNVERVLPSLYTGHAYRDFELPNSNVLRIRALHPDKPEHISGADVIYERHSPVEEKASIVAIQYKIWENGKLYLSDSRMQDQLSKLKEFVCSNTICDSKSPPHDYRFPWCAAFLRPTDKLQNAAQVFRSRGEHIPACKIDYVASVGPNKGKLLSYERMREVSLSTEAFEVLFNSGKIGSDYINYVELQSIYDGVIENAALDRVVLYVQEFAKHNESMRPTAFDYS